MSDGISEKIKKNPNSKAIITL